MGKVLNASLSHGEVLTFLKLCAASYYTTLNTVHCLWPHSPQSTPLPSSTIQIYKINVRPTKNISKLNATTLTLNHLAFILLFISKMYIKINCQKGKFIDTFVLLYHHDLQGYKFINSL